LALIAAWVPLESILSLANSELANAEKAVGKTTHHDADVLRENGLYVGLGCTFFSANLGPDEFHLGVPSRQFMPGRSVRLRDRREPALERAWF
jgi:hypothetical protein